MKIASKNNFYNDRSKFLRVTLIFSAVITALIIMLIFDWLVGFLFQNNNQNLATNSNAIYIAPEFTFSVKTNSLGFRDHEHSSQKSKDIIRIAIVGDSFTYGWGVFEENMWTNQLESLLNVKSKDKRFEIINLGLPGASPYDYKSIVSKYIPIYKPDYVFIALVEGNDFTQVVSDVERSAKSANPEAKNIKKLKRISKLDNITIIDSYISDNDLIELLEESRFTIFPSVSFETFGISIIESYAAGKSVISSTSGALPEIVQNGHTGLLFKTNDIQDCIFKIIKLWKNKKLAHIFGQNASKLVESKYSSTRHYRALMYIYKLALKNQE